VKAASILPAARAVNRMEGRAPPQFEFWRRNRPVYLVPRPSSQRKSVTASERAFAHAITSDTESRGFRFQTETLPAALVHTSRSGREGADPND
jgi:hypothetical protein